MARSKKNFAIEALRGVCSDLQASALNIRKYSEELKSMSNYYRVSCIGDSVETLANRLSIILKMEGLIDD